jgi:hypothetical protein
MTNLRRRLKKLEGQLNDRRGLVPYSGAWIEYCRKATDRILSGEDATAAECIPIEFVDLVLAEAAEEEALDTKVGTREARI